MPAQAAPRVVVSVLPLHALVSEVMTGVGTPHLLIPRGQSPHDYVLKPSDARALRSAALIIRVGPGLEPGLERPLAALDPARVITLLDEPPLEHHVERRSAERIEPMITGALDPHLWLDPENAIAILRLTATRLARIDPAHAALYQRNAATAVARIDRLKVTLDHLLTPVRAQPYLTFHDAYQYLELRYGLTNRGFVVQQAENPVAGARHIRILRDIIRRDQLRCLFTEPEYEPKLIAPVVEGLPVRVAMLDHLGTTLPQGPGLYERMMEKLARDLASCLDSAPKPS
nr:zinc ABC transporter substrate-binding protein [Govania unica]